MATSGPTGEMSSDQHFDAFGVKSLYYVQSPTVFGFGGKPQYHTDANSGLLLLGHRYYDPSIGRFISQDPAQDESNWYAYCANNPLVAVDPTGLAIAFHRTGISSNSRKETEEEKKKFDEFEKAVRDAIEEAIRIDPEGAGKILQDMKDDPDHIYTFKLRGSTTGGYATIGTGDRRHLTIGLDHRDKGRKIKTGAGKTIEWPLVIQLVHEAGHANGQAKTGLKWAGKGYYDEGYGRGGPATKGFNVYEVEDPFRQAGIKAGYNWKLRGEY